MSPAAEMLPQTRRHRRARPENSKHGLVHWMIGYMLAHDATPALSKPRRVTCRHAIKQRNSEQKQQF
eukprot:12415716-Karenia_brevis.AAC.1